MATLNATLTSTYALVIPAASTSFLLCNRSNVTVEVVSTAADNSAPAASLVGFALKEGEVLNRNLLPSGAIWARSATNAAIAYEYA